LAEVVAVSRRLEHRVTKDVAPSILLIEGIGVEGDAHGGEFVKHRSRAKANPTLPNLRQVHLIHAELFAELAAKGFEITPGQMGENITTSNIDLLSLPTGTRLHLGESAVVELTGLRNPCIQLEQMLPGLMHAVLDRDDQNRLIRKAGVMAIVVAGGKVSARDGITVALPAGLLVPLEPV
jgi:MOSC domain-containing protein YiiM